MPLAVSYKITIELLGILIFIKTNFNEDSRKTFGENCTSDYLCKSSAGLVCNETCQ